MGTNKVITARRLLFNGRPDRLRQLIYLAVAVLLFGAGATRAQTAGKRCGASWPREAHAAVEANATWP
jgi:hypothetical protein